MLLQRSAFLESFMYHNGQIKGESQKKDNMCRCSGTSCRVVCIKWYSTLQPFFSFQTPKWCSLHVTPFRLPIIWAAGFHILFVHWWTSCMPQVILNTQRFKKAYEVMSVALNFHLNSHQPTFPLSSHCPALQRIANQSWFDKRLTHCMGITCKHKPMQLQYHLNYLLKQRHEVVGKKDTKDE